MKSTRLGILMVGLVAVTACVSSGPAPDERASESAVKTDAEQICGTRAGFACPPGLVCAENPDDDCDESQGDVDCPGRCVLPPPPQDEDPPLCTTSGLWGQPCPYGYECRGEENCADCPGTCVRKPCAGFLGLDCEKGLVCVDVPNDGCDPQHGGADCPGMCMPDGTY